MKIKNRRFRELVIILNINLRKFYFGKNVVYWVLNGNGGVVVYIDYFGVSSRFRWEIKL